MRRDQDDKIDPQQPALIVTYGNTKRKHRPLDREVILLGRSPGCDLGLVSPEVAPVHCVLVRGTGGWRIRDCSGRPGTYVNGRQVHDEPLCDGDTVQVGSFSFQAHLPRAHPTPQPAPGAPVAPSEVAEQQHRERSRRNLAHHALRLRREVRAGASAQAALARQQADLDRQEARLRGLWREHEARMARPAAPRELAVELPASLDRRRQELAYYAAHLRRQGEKLRAQQESLAQQEQECGDGEAELHQFRLELESDRLLLDEQLLAARQRLAEVEETARGVEQELAHERAELARERAKLEQQRASARPEREGMEEDVSAKLESVRRLRQELAERRQAPSGAVKPPKSRQLRRLPNEQRPV